YTIKGVQRLLREGQIRPVKPMHAAEEEATLPLGLEEVEPEPPTEPEAPEPEATPRRRRAGPEEAMRALISQLLDELVELREILDRGTI
ncbi:MAG TPA: hypothetical protein VKQ70_11915, partial [Caulobacteraceae bacterium]|nr:hypothetical protein [Caulobacteraceae bacterium]